MLRSFNPRKQAQRAQAARERRDDERSERRAALMATTGRKASMGPASTTAKPKTEQHRCPALLEMARGRPCLMCELTGLQLCHPESTVAAHSNLAIHGKAGARKANDEYTAWLGDGHHRWLDQGAAPAEQKLAAFMAAHIAQVDKWRRIATDRSEPERFRRAAQWALDHLNATPVIDLETAP
jgi:hypothetical protein